MGTSLSFDLNDAVSNPQVSVLISSTFVGDPDEYDIGGGLYRLEASVKLRGCEYNDEFLFDYIPMFGTCECDFNFFRYPEKCTEIMRLLFEAGVPFRVIPG